MGKKKPATQVKFRGFTWKAGWRSEEITFRLLTSANNISSSSGEVLQVFT